MARYSGRMTITQFNRIVEIRTKVISMGTFMCGSLFAAVVTHGWSWNRFFVMTFAVLFVDMGTTGFNSYFDFISGTDNKQYNVERDKVLVHEGVDPKIALAISLGLFALAGLLGLLLASWTSFWLVVAGGICMGVGFLYTGGPLPISRTPFGELFAGGFLGTVLFTISYYVQALTFDTHTLLVSVPLLLLIALILTVNNTCDRKADKIAGRKTLSIVLPFKAIRVIMHLLVILPFVLSVLYASLGLLPRLAIPFMAVGFIPAWKSYKAMEGRGFSLETKGPSMGNVSKIFLSFCLAFIASMIGGLLFR